MALVIKGLIILESKCHPNSPVVCDGYVKYEEAEAFMQDFRDWEKINKMDDWRSFLDCINAKFVMVYPCVRPYIMFCIHGSVILHYF